MPPFNMLRAKLPVSQMRRKHKLQRIFVYLGGGVFLLLIAGVLFIKFDTSAAANFTDNVLRPILGPRIVLAMEQAFFNTSDAAKRITANGKTQVSPLLATTTTDALSSNGGTLTVRTIPQFVSFPSIAHEGVWRVKALSQFPNQTVAAYTFVRPDPLRSYAFVTIIQLDMSKLRLSAVAGTKQPGGPIGMPGPGIIPQQTIQSNTLVAAFDGGFQYRDGQYGMRIGSTTYVPLQQNIGTLVGYVDGSLKIVNYSGQSLGSNVAFIRQNCPILVENGQVVALNELNKKLWGRTFSSDIITWRSGIGLTANGNLLFAVGNSLTPQTLGQALKMAGAASALQLDINPNWVRFNFFEPTGPGTYASTTLTKDLKDGSKAYLTGYSKDFFYVTKK